MLAKDAISRLREHSGLSVPTPQLEGSAFIDRVQALQKGNREADLEKAVVDILECLQTLNSYSSSTCGNRDYILNIDTVYAISGILLSTVEASIILCATGKDCKELLMAAWKISCAWDALLAGDVEDIHQHLAYEMAARNLM
jgi:hypothetical protein